MSNELWLEGINKSNWEEAMELTYGDDSFVSVSEGLAAAYVKPWDEALDPYVIKLKDKIIGFIYVSYTPHSEDNYWIGGFYIKKEFRGNGYGRNTIDIFIKEIVSKNPECRIVRLTVEADNTIAKNLYESLGFKSDKTVNKYGEVRFAKVL